MERHKILPEPAPSGEGFLIYIVMEEQWKDVDDKGFYQVSTNGRVRSWKNGRWGKRKTPKIIKLGYCRRGYDRVKIQDNETQVNCSVHRLVAQAFIPNPEKKPQVNHKDGNKKNNHISNLEWVTNQENMDHAHENNLFNYKKGQDSGVCSLTIKEAEKVRKMYFYTETTQKEIASIFNVSQKTISNIVNNLYY